jgi:hypothetical protein
MAALGNSISIDLHIVGDVELDTIRGIMRDNGRLRSELAEALRQAIENTARNIIADAGAAGRTLSVDLRLVEETVPGAPRQRVGARLDVEGDRSQLAAVEEALDAPRRARISEAAEACLDERLQERDLANAVGRTVIVPPVEFR